MSRTGEGYFGGGGFKMLAAEACSSSVSASWGGSGGEPATGNSGDWERRCSGAGLLLSRSLPLVWDAVPPDGALLQRHEEGIPTQTDRETLGNPQPSPEPEKQTLPNLQTRISATIFAWESSGCLRIHLELAEKR